MSCSSDCADENLQQDAVSPGPVQDHEGLCRAAYGKTMHYNASGKVRPSFVKNNDLLAGSLSVWRRHTGSADEFSDIRSILNDNGPVGTTLYDVFCAPAQNVRGIRVSGFPSMQVLHVYDDCRTDTNGGKHPLHAVVAICGVCDPQSLDKDSPLYIEIRDQLVNLLKQNNDWSLPGAQRV